MATTTRPDPDEPRAALYEVVEDESLSLAETQEAALRIGCEYLDVENGHVERVADGETHEIVASVGPDDLLPAGEDLSRATTYCRRTLDRDTSLALSEASAEGWADDPAYREHGFECYLGAAITVDGEQYGTVCFISRAARDHEFEPSERSFVELVARMLGRERERAEHSRRMERTEDKYRTLVETAPDAIFLADAEAARIVEANEQAADLTGYDEADLVGTCVYDLHPAEYEAKYRDLFVGDVEEPVDRFDDGTPLHIVRADGTRVPVELSSRRVDIGGDTYVQGIARDITERREREQELRVKDRAIEAADAGITIADATDPDLPLVYANDGFTRMTGYDSEDVLGQNCRFLQGPCTDEETVREIRSALDASESLTTDVLNYRADGTPFWNELSLTPVTGECGDVTHFVGIQQNRTARKRRERLVGVLNRMLRHNLRNDLSVVLSFAEAIASNTDGTTAAHADRIASTAKGIVEQSEKVQVLESVADGSRETAAIDAADVARQIADRLDTQHAAATVTVDAPETAPVRATSHLLDVLSELGENAIVHDPGEARVDIRVEPRGDRVDIHVADDGPGLHETERTVLEEGTETPLQHGSGIGLFLVRWFVTEFGGSVEVAGDDGTTVTLSLLAPEETATDRGDWATVISSDW